MKRRRKIEIMKSLFNNYVDKQISKMNAAEKLTYLSQNMVFQLEIRKRKIIQGKQHKEIITDKNDPANWYCKRILSEN
jgi:hypothetical protein